MSQHEVDPYHPKLAISRTKKQGCHITGEHK